MNFNSSKRENRNKCWLLLPGNRRWISTKVTGRKEINMDYYHLVIVLVWFFYYHQVLVISHQLFFLLLPNTRYWILTKIIKRIKINIDYYYLVISHYLRFSGAKHWKLIIKLIYLHYSTNVTGEKKINQS